MLKWFADLVTYQWLSLVKGTRLADAANFFIYDTLKIFIMLSVIIFVVAIIRSFFPPEKTRKILSYKRQYAGNIVAALLGIVTPFCSCSAVPVFIGFVEAGIPLGVTFSFLISSPMVNEVALILLWGMFGTKIALIYIATGLVVAVVSGLVIGKIGLERYVEGYVYEIAQGIEGMEMVIAEQTWEDRLLYAREYVRDILKRVWPYVLIGIGLGAAIHGYVPTDFLAAYAGKDNIFAVPVAVLMGVPLYSNAAGVIPLVAALQEKGMAMGTVLAFMMSVTALSLPEMIILRNVLKPQLIGVFIGIVAASIIIVGYLFNALLTV
ncbi:permease [Syntrophomonas palmitatica]|uniref:permease n=1 Tax=Syntrophomonas palmitatica TaxID=402877 RepID=UPI0006CF4D12|nr:permease [Syntrophomonas palmitatica]